MAEISSHKELEVWRLSMSLAKTIYNLTAKFPKVEEYRMTAQLIRAATSIPANIAEGNSRGSRKDYANFVSIARGSAAELETLLLLSREVGLAQKDGFIEPLEMTASVGRMLNALRQKLSSPSPQSPVPNPQ
jgi:four helix bundle protein